MKLLRTVVPLLMTAIGCTPGFSGNSEIDPTLYPEPSRNAITFWGHATTYIDIEGFGIVTDPVFEKSYSPFHARRIPAPPPEAYDQTSVILISHAQRDHLNPKTLRRFSKDVVVLCPELSANHVQGLGLEVHIMAPGDEYIFPGGRIVAVPAHHPGGRNTTKTDHDGRALGYVIHARGRSIYYSGDTEYFHGMYTIRREHFPDVALLNINDHLNSYDAMFAISALGNPTVIPIHRGVYGDSGFDRLEELIRLKGDLIVPLGVGESFPIEERESGVAPLTPVP